MDPVELYHKLGVKPFQPVRVHLTNGRTYDILHRQLAVVGETYLDIGIPVANQPLPIADDIIRVQLQEIRSVEPLPLVMPPVGR
jgi:hypothetical protein